MQDTLNRIEQRLDDLDRRWERNNVLLEEHIKRTEMLERRVEPIETSHKTSKLLVKIVAWAVGGGGVLTLAIKTLLSRLNG
jgi:hypothetical protein